MEAADYCRENGIILKGDIPIGVNKVSIDTWERTTLFNMDTCTGAPPDAFSETGQNWGFPTYNWEQMQTDEFRWWQMRFRVMGRYFDAFRIDHVLGWFRIWEIPGECVKGNGRLGHFYPATPIRWVDLQRMNLSSHWDRKRLCEPWNPPSVVGALDINGEKLTQESLEQLEKLGILRFEANMWQFNMKECDADLLLQD